jgi:hypothetical protein
MQKLRIIGIFFENRLHWLFELGKKILHAAVLVFLVINLQVKHKYIIPYIYWKISGKIEPARRFSTLRVEKCFAEGPTRFG